MFILNIQIIGLDFQLYVDTIKFTNPKLNNPFPYV